MADGSIELLGSMAASVDLRGFAVEPGRAEAALARCPGVAAVAVVPVGDGAGGERLVAHVVPVDAARPPTLAGLRRWLWSELPGYAWPAALTVVDRLPADGDAGPGGGGPGGETTGEAPTPEEVVLACLWDDVRGATGVDGARPESNYWQSFSFLEALALARRCGVDIPHRKVLRNRTIRALAADLAAG
jgi:hypothetical protein